jgi:uncharacterized protein (UPF0332 family)
MRKLIPQNNNKHGLCYNHDDAIQEEEMHHNNKHGCVITMMVKYQDEEVEIKTITNMGCVITMMMQYRKRKCNTITKMAVL